MNILIIEDEQLAAQKLNRLLSELVTDYNLLASIPSVEKAINWFSTQPVPDLIFMDIQLEDGICFEIFENVQVSSPVIFTTAYSEYTLKAFKVNSVDYLLKPIEKQELHEAIVKYQKVFLPQAANISALLPNFEPKNKERFLVKVGERFISIPTNTINCFFVQAKGCYLNANEGRCYAIEYSLDKVEQITDNKQFFRVNRNVLVNIYVIQEIVAYSTSRLKITIQNWKEEDDVLVSRDRVQAFKTWMDR